MQIQCVVVLYERSPDESETLQSLQKLASSHGELVQQLSLLIYDNSSRASEMPSPHLGAVPLSYVHNPSNPGVAAAYQYARDQANSANLEWLLLLDQDTNLTAEFLSELIATLAHQPAAEIGAIVPRLIREGNVLSPQRIGNYHNLPIASDLQGRSPDPITALNAGACIRVSAFPRPDALTSRFPLDYHDHAMFFTLQKEGYGIHVLRSSLRHQLSLKSLDQEMSLSRYTKVLQAECRFVQATGWGGGMLVHRLRLLKRAAGQVASLENKQFAWCSVKAAVGLGAA